MKFTIFTPTYNRKDYLKILYKSLLEQTFKDFEWIIVDDGSSDDTEIEVKKFIEEEKLKISYFKQQNGGKHRAINRGTDLAQGEYFFIVDSDDFLPKDSLKKAAYQLSLVQEDNTIGVIGLRQIPNGKFLGKEFPENNMLLNHIERNYQYKLKGDYAEIIKTEIIKQFKFPDFKNEKFCAEGLIWNRIAAAGYNFLCFNEPIYHGNYLDEGLTANSIKNRHKNNAYSSLLYQELSKSKDLPFLQRIRSRINLYRFTKNFYINNFNLVDIISLPIGFLFKRIDKRRL